MGLPPASVIASWPTPNYVDPVTRGPGLVITNIIMCTISFGLTVLRIYTRGFITVTIGLDDVLVALALMITIAMCVITSLAAQRYGWDRHLWDMPLDLFSGALKCRMGFEITFCAASTLTKLSLLWFCRRILGNSINGRFRTMNRYLIAAMALLVALGILFVFMVLFNCIPIKAYFDILPNYPYHCLNGGAVLIAASVANVVTDFLVTVIPMPLIWQLKLPRRQRLAVISIFGIGISVTICSSIRTYYAWMDAFGSYDSSWYGWVTGLTASLEINLGLICASAPALRPLIKTIWPRIFSSNKPSGYASGSQQKPKPWSPAARYQIPHTSSSPKTQVNTISGSINKQYFGTEASVVRTVELDTVLEERTFYMQNQKPRTNSVWEGTRSRNETRDDYEMRYFRSGARDHVSYYMERDSSRESRGAKTKFYEEDEKPFASQGIV